MRRERRLGAGVAGAAIVIACGRVPEPGATADGGGGAGGFVYPGPDGAAGTGGALAGGGGGTDPGWIPQDWPKCEGLEVARDPAASAPTLEWEPCGDRTAGCLHMVKPDDPEGGKVRIGYTQGASERVYSLGGDLRAVLPVHTRSAVTHVAYGRDGRPWFAVRSAGVGDARCRLLTTEWSSRGVCVAVTELSRPEAAIYRVDGVGGLVRAARELPAEVVETCGESLATMLGAAGEHWISDLTTDRDVSLRADARPRVHADRAYYFRGGELLEWTGLGSRLLFDVDPDVVVDARTDGETLVWLRAPSWDLEPGQLWRAPLQGGLPVDPVPFAVAPPVAPAPAFHRIGGGYYAVIEGSASSIPDHPTRLHLYRLADGRHWIVPDQPDQYTV